MIFYFLSTYIYPSDWVVNDKFENRNAQRALNGKDPDAGKDWGQEEKGAIEDGMIGRYHQLNGHEFELTQGNGEGQGNLACYSPWDCKESDTTE